MPEAVYVIWWIVIVVAVLALPIVVYLLHRTLRAALNIARYMREMREAGEGIAAHTSHIVALGDTIDTGGALLSTAGDIDAHVGAIEDVIESRTRS